MPIAMLYLLYHMIACTMNNSISRFDAQSRCRGYKGLHNPDKYDIKYESLKLNHESCVVV